MIKIIRICFFIVATMISPAMFCSKDSEINFNNKDLVTVLRNQFNEEFKKKHPLAYFIYSSSFLKKIPFLGNILYSKIEGCYLRLHEQYLNGLVKDGKIRIVSHDEGFCIRPPDQNADCQPPHILYNCKQPFTLYGNNYRAIEASRKKYVEARKVQEAEVMKKEEAIKQVNESTTALSNKIKEITQQCELQRQLHQKNLTMIEDLQVNVRNINRANEQTKESCLSYEKDVAAKLTAKKEGMEGGYHGLLKAIEDLKSESFLVQNEIGRLQQEEACLKDSLNKKGSLLKNKNQQNALLPITLLQSLKDIIAQLFSLE